MRLAWCKVTSIDVTDGETGQMCHTNAKSTKGKCGLHSGIRDIQK